MQPAFSLRTVCGLEELDSHRGRGVTHVLSLLDPDWPDPEAFRLYDRHHRMTLRFHDVIVPMANATLPEPEHVAEILAFGRSAGVGDEEGHLLIHCHLGVSRSTAAMTALIADAHPDEGADAIFERLLAIRPQAWPNSRMIGFADDLLGRRGELVAALGRVYAGQLKTRPHLDEVMMRLNRGREIEMARES